MLRVLVISNSFGQDSVRYLNGISRAAGKEISVANLYIGGCPLSHHFRNIMSDEKEYVYEQNGVATPFKVSIKQALLLNDWDVVVTQQASVPSGKYETYVPYLRELAAFIRKMCPKAKLLLNETWSFKDGIPRFQNTGYLTNKEHFEAIQTCYRRALEEISADALIPSGTVVEKLYGALGERAYRDGFHCNYGVTRYALGLLWYRFLMKAEMPGKQYTDFDTEVSPEDIAIANQAVEETLAALSL